MNAPEEPLTDVSDIRLLHTVFLLRHGQHAPESPDKLEGGLTALGRRQARRTAQRLAGQPIGLLVASDLRRARQTAEIVAAEHPAIAVETDLRECVPSVPPGLAVFPHLGGVPDKATAECRERLDRAFDRYFAASPTIETIFLVAHGNAICYLLCRVLKLPTDAWARFAMNNCGLSRVDVHTGVGRQVTGFNDVGHLSPSMVTWGYR